MKLTIEVPEPIKNSETITAALGIPEGRESNAFIATASKETMDFLADLECENVSEFFLNRLREGKITDSMLLFYAIMGFKTPLDGLERMTDAFRSMMGSIPSNK